MNPEPDITPYTLIGEAAALEELVNRFYQYMSDLPEAAGIRALHEPDLTRPKDRLFKFLSGWLGGPDLFIQEFGHPRLRMRHYPFPIGPAERDQWMLCMSLALNDMNLEPKLHEQLLNAFWRTADHMINREPQQIDSAPTSNDQ